MRAFVTLSACCLFVALASAGPASARHGAVAARSCNKPVANLKVYVATGMTCAQAARDLGRSLSVCCQARFRSRGGFFCTATTGGDGRCVKGRRAYRFDISEDV